MTQLTEEEILHRAASYCSQAERCPQDVIKKIRTWGGDEACGGRIIARLKNEKFIDETRYTHFFINDKLRFNQWGRIKLDYELKKREISNAVRSEALNDINEELYQDILYNLLRTKTKSIKAKDQREKYYKLMRFAAGRGFECQAISQSLKKLFNGENYDDME